MSTQDSNESKSHRFYGRRHGHALRPGRRQLIEAVLPTLKIPQPGIAETIQLPELFGSEKRAYWMEIGFGSGEHLAALAEANPEIGFVGCEPYINGVAALVSVIDSKELTNIRLFNDDAHLLFASLPDAVFERIYLPYADPWPKKRHHRRRLVQIDTLETFARLLVDEGEFRFASDHMGYVRWVLEIAAGHPTLEWTARRPKDWRTRPRDSIETRYEAKA